MIGVRAPISLHSSFTHSAMENWTSRTSCLSAAEIEMFLQWLRLCICVFCNTDHCIGTGIARVAHYLEDYEIELWITF